MNQALLRAAHESLEKLVIDFRKGLDGISDEELNTWKPAAAQAGGGEMNTLAALGVHTALAGTWMIVHQTFGHEFPRDRVLEFDATSSRAEIDQLFETMLQRFAELIETEADVDLAALPPTIRPTIPEWTRLNWLLHAIDHTGLHLGHVEITRQLWLAERGQVQG